jgi:hypothetical protein
MPKHMKAPPPASSTGASRQTAGGSPRHAGAWTFRESAEAGAATPEPCLMDRWPHLDEIGFRRRQLRHAGAVNRTTKHRRALVREAGFGAHQIIPADRRDAGVAPLGRHAFSEPPARAALDRRRGPLSRVVETPLRGFRTPRPGRRCRAEAGPARPAERPSLRGRGTPPGSSAPAPWRRSSANGRAPGRARRC